MESKVMPTRRSSDPIIVNFATSIGKLTGVLETYIKNQDMVNENLMGSLDSAHRKGDQAHKRLDSVSNKAIGFGACAGLISAFLAWILKAFT